MTAATVTKRLEVNDPTVEVVQLTVSDGETYTSKKFSSIDAAIISSNADATSNSDLIVTTSGGVATIKATGVTDALMTLVLYGRK